MQSVYLQRIMKKNAAKGYEKTKPKQTQFPKCQKMNANLFVTKDYENETTLRPKKTNPIQTQYSGCQRSDICLLPSVFCPMAPMIAIEFSAPNKFQEKKLLTFG